MEIQVPQREIVLDIEPEDRSGNAVREVGVASGVKSDGIRKEGVE